MPIPIPPPSTTKTVPPVTAVALIETKVFLPSVPEVSNKSGKPADNPAKIKRFTPNATKTKIVSSIPVAPFRISPAIKINVKARNKFAKRITLCREMRSKIVPTNGPTKEYGSKTTANATAADFASGWRSGEKSKNDASDD